MTELEALKILKGKQQAAQRAPASLDRRRWEGCEYCKDIPASILKGFCYACGRPLTDEAWAELERRINDETTD